MNRLLTRIAIIMSAKIPASNSPAISLTVELNNGKRMPVIGFGTFRVTSAQEIYKCVDAALEAGYRSFDSATVYRNEHLLGKAFKDLLPKYNLKREDIFITSKLAPADLYPENVEKAVMSSCSNFQTSYLDLYLIHWPGAAGLPGENKRNITIRAEAWKILADLNKRGVLRSIGVSNYTKSHLEHLFSNDSGVRPVLNQVEIHPHYRTPDLVEFCQKNNVYVQAYCSLGGTGQKSLLQDQTVVKVAKKLKHSPAQVLLRWALQEDLLIIPKSVTPERIKENTQLDFVIPEDDMKQLNNISTHEKFGWDPLTVV